ncbi:glycosyltransferase family protein [Gracilibacillus sp. JCM 18860]|uniref:glycosyltransferase family protein n=1 Tax=Gracilibacillus sp. JCM 18860 TaxID=1306159 RepID=UPI000B335DF8
MKVVAIIQARMGSTRLPGKVLKKIKGGETVLSHVINRVSKSKNVDNIVIATTIQKDDDQIVKEVTDLGYTVYRGSENDVLERYYQAILQSSANIIIRITSDCPLIDPIVIDEMVEVFINNNYSLVTNAGADASLRTFPRGLDVEIFSREALEKAYINATLPYQREHVTPYIYENEASIFYYKNKEDNSNHRWTLDTKEDYRLIEEIYNNLYMGGNTTFI